MFAARKKIAKTQNPTPIEEQVAQALHDLEQNSQTTDLKAELHDLQFSSAQEIDVGNKKAVIVFVPFRSLGRYRKIQQRLVRDLEKKLSGKHVVIVAQRTVIRKPSKQSVKKMQKIPYSRTLTAVHEAILEDIVYPTDIIGKRTRVRLDGSNLMKVQLDIKDQTNQEYKLGTFTAVYKKLTGKEATFSFQKSRRVV